MANKKSHVHGMTLVGGISSSVNSWAYFHP